MDPNTNFSNEFRDNLIPDPFLSEWELFIVPDSDVVRSFARYFVAQPELGGIFVYRFEIIYPLRFSFISPIFGRIPFLFLVAFLRRLVGICQFSWFVPGNRLYEMIYCTASDVNQPSGSIPYCRVTLLIRFVMYQCGYVADVPLNRMLRGQSPDNLSRNVFSEVGEPYFHFASEEQMIAYFGWRVASVCCFSNAELNYLRVLFEIPLSSLVRDYQRAELRVSVDEEGEYYEYDPVGEDGRRIYMNGRPEELRYNNSDEMQQLLLELQGVGRSEVISSRLLNEISLYTLRRSEGYVQSEAIDVMRVGIHLVPYLLEYCLITERPFPRRANDDLGILPIQWEDAEFIPLVRDEIGSSDRIHPGSPSRGRYILDDDGRSRERGDFPLQDLRLDPGLGFLERDAFSFMAGLTPFFQELDHSFRVRSHNT